MYIIQSVHFDINNWSIIDSVNWILNNDFKVKKIEESDNYYRYKQKSLTQLKKRGYTQYKVKKLGRGIERAKLKIKDFLFYPYYLKKSTIF